MSRKKVHLTAFLCVTLGASIGLAQGLYVTANGGYNLGAGTQQIGNNTTSTGPTTSYEGVYGSFGEGLKIGASAGYMFDETFGTELGLSYWLGKSIELTYKSTAQTRTSKLSGWGIVAVPAVVISTNLKPVRPYARFGLVLGLLRTKNELSNVETGSNWEIVTEDRGGIALGIAGALGIIVPTGGGVDFFGEVVLHAVDYSPSTLVYTKYTVNNVDQLPSISQKEIDYKESFSSSDQYVTLAIRRPFSSIGLTAGVRINL